MLSAMRKNAGSLIIKILFGVIIIVFVLWGVGTNRSDRANQVASVNGEVISLDDYGRVYENLVEQMRSRFGGRLDEDTIRMLNLRSQAVNQLVDEQVILQEARKMGIKVSDEELTASIQNIPAFRVDGVFDARQYNRVLASNRLTPEAFEAGQRQAIMVRRLADFVVQGVRVSESEAREWYDWRNALVNVEYLRFTASEFGDVSVSEEEIADYYRENSENYKTEAQVKARYIAFRTDNYRAGVTVDEDEIAEYYAENPEEFAKPESVEARHILLKVDPNADDETVESVRKKAEDIYEKAQGGEDFAELAKAHSEGPTRDAGGYLGSFARGAMVKPFEDQAFSMEPGEIGAPVRTQFGWHVIKVENRTPEATVSLEEAADRIRDTLTERKAKLTAYDAAQDAYDATYDDAELPAIAESFKAELMTTDFFGSEGPQGLVEAGRFAQIALDMDAGEISEVEEFPDGYYLIQVTEQKPAAIPELASVRSRVEEDLKNRKQKENAAQAASAALEKVKAGESLESVARAAGKAIVETGFFGRNDSVEEVGFDPVFSEASFSLSEGKPLVDEVVNGRSGYYLLRFKARNLPDPAEFENEKAMIQSQLLQRKQIEAYTSWLEAARQRSEIVIEKGFLE
ncbi:MAG: SurA N-terminal domain-containing protein [Desulfobacterales bacterium]